MKYIRTRNFKDWFIDLLNFGFLKLVENEPLRTYYLKPPLQIIVKKKVVDSLSRRYRSDYEIGGILLAEPARIGLVNVLLVDGVRYVRNMSRDPGAYQANISMKKYIRECFQGTKSGKRHFPIKFHSHPRGPNGLPEMFMTYFQMSTSESDKKRATSRYRVTCKKCPFVIALPSILCIVSDDNEVFLGVYGGNIAPKDFVEYGEKILCKMSDEAMSRGLEAKSLFNKITGIISALGISIAASGFRMSNPQLRSFAMQIVLLRKSMKTDDNYFTMVKNEDAVVEIPS